MRRNELEEMAGRLELPLVQRLNRDLSKTAYSVSSSEARHMVTMYYVMQEYRIATSNQERSLLQRGSVQHELITFMTEQWRTLEANVYLAMERYTDRHPVGSWMKAQRGIGPIISAGLLAHLDITRAPTAGHFWRIAGLDPSVSWPSTAEALESIKRLMNERGEKVPSNDTLEILCRQYGRNLGTILKYMRPLLKEATEDEQNYNDPPRGEIIRTAESAAKSFSRLPWSLALKRLQWNLGECFVRSGESGKEENVYRNLYIQRKLFETERNNRGDNAEKARLALEKTNYSKDTEAYKELSKGRLPKAQIHGRAKRYAVKIFLSHLHDVWYRVHYNTAPPAPFAIQHLGHAHMIPVPKAHIAPEVKRKNETPGGWSDSPTPS